jgi:hypothetical protein
MGKEQRMEEEYLTATAQKESKEKLSIPFLIRLFRLRGEISSWVFQCFKVISLQERRIIWQTKQKKHPPQGGRRYGRLWGAPVTRWD